MQAPAQRAARRAQAVVELEKAPLKVKMMKHQLHHAAPAQLHRLQELQESAAAFATQNPNKCTHYLRAISTKIEIISCHRMVHNKNSTDLSSGRRPLSKTDEFLL